MDLETSLSPGSPPEVLQSTDGTSRSRSAWSRRQVVQDPDASGDLVESPNGESQVPEVEGSKATSKRLAGQREGINERAPPLSNPSDIFEDLLERALQQGFRGPLAFLAGRKVKIATMCSGTESPILACRLIADACSDQGLEFGYEHMFSAEIVPFKQAFIERNFKPPKLFRNITELGKGSKAETAYGASAELPRPGEVHILVAGFACVDFSHLNNKRKELKVSATDLGTTAADGNMGTSAEDDDGPSIPGVDRIREEGGESSRTFRAVAKYARDFRPSIIILENIKNAPWGMIKEVFEGLDYSAKHALVDTKSYYLPQTRQRGYMICINHGQDGVPGGMTAEAAEVAAKGWADVMGKLKRGASSPVEDFLLPQHSPLLVRALEEAERDQRSGPTIRTEIDWAICLGRHVRYRQEHRIGDKTPYTGWSSGKSRMPEYALIPWGRNLPARQKDALDILALTSAANGFDFEFKARYPDLSQNVDRSLDSAPRGITGCLTPSGEVYSSANGRPIVGLEALALQGLPIDRLHLTRESQKELQDLAGNAMTTPVVGAALLAAFITAYKSLPESTLGAADKLSAQTEAGLQNVTTSLPLITQWAQFNQTTKTTMSELCQMAKRSAKLCYCENQSSLALASLYRCENCYSTACGNCVGIPSHSFRVLHLERMQPQEFRDHIVKALPTRLSLNLSVDDYRQAQESIQLSQHSWSYLADFLATIGEALGEELLLHSITRSRFWIVCYASLRLRLELTFQSSFAQWTLYAIPKAKAPVNDPVRVLLKEPIARMILYPSSDSILHGTWELNLPSYIETTVQIEEHGGLVPSWESDLGILQFKDAKVYSRLSLKLDDNTGDEALRAIEGDYELLISCGTAKRALHVKRTADNISPTTSPRLYLFLDPDRIGRPAEDQFVISPYPGKLFTGESREVIARLDKDFCLSTVTREPALSSRKREIRCTKNGSWVICKASLAIPVDETSSFMFPSCDLQDYALTFPHGVSCKDAFVTIFQSCVPWFGPSPDGRRSGRRCEITEYNQEHMLANLKWLVSRLPNFSENPDKWTQMTVPCLHYRCYTCSPKRPQVKWRESEDGLEWKSSARRRKVVGNNKTMMIPFEDASEAQPYERAVKERPSPFLLQVEPTEPFDLKKRNITIAINFQALAHRVLGTLIAGLNESSLGHINVLWRLLTSPASSSRPSLPAFVLSSNQTDMPQPFTFDGINTRTGHALKLRIEQQRSLRWMIGQDSVHTDPFEEDVREESSSAHLGWRLEARVTKLRQVRGGIIADDVGYGKTVTMLALIKNQMQEATVEALSSTVQQIPLSATCVITPTTLIQQWKDEILHFWPGCNVLSINSSSTLEKTTIGQFQDAQIVLVSIGLFDKEAYTQRQAELAALPKHPQLNSLRSWKAWFEQSSERVKLYTAQLKQHSSPSQFDQVLSDDMKNYELDSVEYNIIPSRRLKGDTYAHALKSAETTQPGNVRSKLQIRLTKDQISGFKEATGIHDVKNPTLSMFRFHRKVIDEQTYVDSRQLVAIQSIVSCSTWILSGTPSLRFFADVKRMATFLGIFLGVDDDTEAAETFEAYRSLRSSAWYEARHEIAQKFLDRFARKNHAEFGEIPMKNVYQPVVLDAVHRTTYMELESQLVSEEAKISTKDRFGLLSHDRSRRFMDVLTQNPSRRAALVRLATKMASGRKHIEEKSKDMATGKARKRTQADLVGQCEDIQDTSYQAIRSAREADCRRMLLSLHYHLEKVLQKLADCSEEIKERFRKMIRHNVFNGHGDPRSNEAINRQFMQHKVKIASVLVIIAPEAKRRRNDKIKTDIEVETRQLLEEVDRLFSAIVASFRAERYLGMASKLQNAIWNGNISLLDCGCTLRQSNNYKSSRLNRECGHSYCIACCGDYEGFCAIAGCKARVLASNIILPHEITSAKHLSHTHTDAKVDSIISLIEGTKPYDKVLVFSQFDEIGVTIENRLTTIGLSCIRVPRTATAAAQNHMSDFRTMKYRDPGWKKVLVLDPLDSSAAGHNLTNVHLVIFVSPILTESRDKYESAYLQAIGRARRHGQTRMVEVYHFVTLNTADINIVEERSGGRLAFRGDRLSLEHGAAVRRSGLGISSRLYSDLEESYEVCIGDDVR